MTIQQLNDVEIAIILNEYFCTVFKSGAHRQKADAQLVS